MESDDDDGSFLSAERKRPRVNASVTEMASTKNGAKIVLSIQSSDDDDDDDDDIATLRASQSFGDTLLNGNDDDITIEKLHETQEAAHHSTPWSPLTASPFTPHGGSTLMNHTSSRTKNDRRVSNVRDVTLITASSLAAAEVPPISSDITTTINHGRRGLNLSKVRPSHIQKANEVDPEKDILVARVSHGSNTEQPTSHSNENVKMNAAIAITTKSHKTNSGVTLTTTNATTSVLESSTSTILNPSPPPQHTTTTQGRTEKKQSLTTNSMDWKSNDTPNGRSETHVTLSTSTSGGQKTQVFDIEVIPVRQKKNSKTTVTKRTKDAVTMSVDDDDIKIPVQKPKKSTKESTKSITNKENVQESLLNTKKTKEEYIEQPVNDPPAKKKKPSKSISQVEKAVEAFIEQSVDDPPAKKKKSSKSVIEKVDDTKSTTSSKAMVPKPKKLTFEEQVMVHMLNALKPFTLKLLSEEMKASEASINFVLLSLVDKGLVVQKDFASSKGRVKTLYWANHDAKAKEVKIGTTEDTLATKEERDAVHRQMLDLRNELATIRNHYQQVMQTPSNDDLTHLLTKQESELQELYRTRDEVHARIRTTNTTIHTTTTVPRKGFQNTKTIVPSVKDKCPVRLKKRINHLRDEWKKRKTKCMDFVEQLADGLEKKPKDIITLCDIDTDEMNSVVLPVKYPM